MQIEEDIELLNKDIINEIIEAKGSQINLIDLRKISTIADYFIIASANNERQVNAIVDRILKKVNEDNFHDYKIEGRNSGRWVLIDFGDIVVHIFHEDERKFYNLEKLWNDENNIIEIENDENWNSRTS